MSIYADIDNELAVRLDGDTDDNGLVLDALLSEHSDEDIETFWRMFDIHCEMIAQGWSDEVTEDVDIEVVRRYCDSAAA